MSYPPEPLPDQPQGCIDLTFATLIRDSRLPLQVGMYAIIGNLSMGYSRPVISLQ